MNNKKYVNYKVALLLQQKGYDERCRTFYKNWDNKIVFYDCDNSQMFDYCFNSMLLNEYTFEDEKNIAAPVQQDILIWLRIKYNIVVWVEPSNIDHDESILWKYYIKVPEKAVTSSEDFFSNPEEAINNSLEYILTNII